MFPHYPSGLAKLKLTATMARREESRKVIDRAAAQAAAKGATADVRPHLKKFESKIEMDKSGAVGTPAWYARCTRICTLMHTQCAH